MMPHAASRDVSGLLAEGVAEPVAGAEPALDRLPVRLDGEIRLLPVAEVLYCYANGDRTMLVVCSVIPWTRNAFSLTLEGGKEVPLSKHRAGELRKLLGW